MKKKLLLSISILFFAFSAKAQITLAKTYGVDSAAEGANDGQQTSDGGYILAGIATPSVYEIVKTDSTGDTLWTKSIPGKSLYSVQEVADGFIFAGGPHIYLLKTDLTGQTLWSHTYSTNTDPGADFGYSVRQTSDNGYIITGQKNYNGTTFHGDICLIKTDSAGGQAWVRLLTTGLTDCAGRSVQQTTDGGYIVGGYSYNQVGAGSNFDLALMKTDTAGMLQWSKYFGSPAALGQVDRGYAVKQTTDGGYILAGTYSESLSHQSVLVKTDSNGDTLWTKLYGIPSQGFALKSVWQTTDGGYVAAGGASTDLLYLKTNSNGDTLWTKIIDGSDFTTANYIQQTADGGYVIIGFTAAPEFSNNLPNGYDQLLIVTDSLGNFPDPTISSINNNTTRQSLILIYPNPSKNDLIIQNNSLLQFQFALFNSLGESIFMMPLVNKVSTIDLSGYSKGVYTAQIFSANKSFCQKIIKL
jgi:hypothetical protein